MMTLSKRWSVNISDFMFVESVIMHVASACMWVSTTCVLASFDRPCLCVELSALARLISTGYTYAHTRYKSQS